MTKAVLAPGDLDGLDELDVDTLALPLFEARMQPRLVAGYADWRLSGRIARLIRDGRFVGHEGDALLMPAMGRFGAERIFLLGLGKHEKGRKLDFKEMISVLAEAGAKRLAIGLPAVPDSGESGTDTVAWAEAFFSAMASRKGAFDTVTMLDPDERLKAGRDRLKKAAKQAGLSWEA